VTVRLRAGKDAVVVEPDAGGRLSSLTALGIERLLGFESQPEGRDADIGWGCFLMAPWVGRLDEGQVPFRGYTRQVPAEHYGHAIHGVLRDTAWRVEHTETTEVTLTCGLDAARWPFGGWAAQRIALAAGCLTLEAQVVAGDSAMPVSVGWHPWFRRPDDGDLRVGVVADEVLETRDDLIPTGAVLPVDDRTDLRAMPALGDRVLDHAYIGIRRPVKVVWPDLELTLDMPANPATVVVHTPPRGVCVEPQTAWPNAPVLHARGNAGTGLVELAAGERLRARTVWHWSATDG